MEIKEIKQQLSITTVLNHYGHRPDKNHRMRCPFHPDKTPSMQVYEKTNTVYCFSSNCKTHGKSIDAIDFIMLSEGITKHEAIKKAESFINTQTPETRTPLPTAKSQEPKAILTKLFKSFQNGLSRAEKPKAYLQSRNLDYTKLEAGYNSGQFHHHNKLSEKEMKACIDAGLLIAYKGKTPHAKGQSYTAFAKDCIIFPLKNEIVSFYGRSIINNSKSKHFYLKNRSGLYPGYPEPKTTKLILTEAIIDAATLLQYPIINKRYSILSLYGTNGLTAEHTEAVSQLKKLQEIIFFFDGDEAGKKAVEKYANELKTINNQYSISNVAVPQNEDINSLLQGHAVGVAESPDEQSDIGKPDNIFTHLLENRKEFFLSNEISIEKKNHNNLRKSASHSSQILNQKSSILNVNNPDYITYTTENHHFTLLGGINLQQLDRLRVTLKISFENRSIRHTLDLYHSDYVEKFIQKAAEKLETGSSLLSRAMDELTDKVEQYRLSKIESQKQQKPKQRQLTEQRYRKAVNYLKQKNLLERTNKDIGKTGVIGEETNRLLMYLVFTSRLREQPLHIISLGGSGTGKTYLQEKISELIPENDKKEITILSENAFYYFERTELKHKLVLIEDMDGAQEVLYPLRELQSKKKISKTIPLKDQKGNLKTVTLQVEGPICLAGTTTKERLYEDNANRSLLIYLDNTSEHKEKIMDYQRAESAGQIKKREESEIREFFKDMQTVLKPIKVRNPYAEMLKIPEHVFKPLRTNSHYLAFIETITFYHQYQREIKTNKETGERYIETTLEDIEAANRLLKEVLLAKADELPRQIREFFETLKKKVKKSKQENFYSKEIREQLRIYPMKVNRYLRELESRNFIQKTGGNRKNGYEYKINRWDDYQKLQSGADILNDILTKIREETTINTKDKKLSIAV